MILVLILIQPKHVLPSQSSKRLTKYYWRNAYTRSVSFGTHKC